jgi:hypothetical protein
MDSVKPVQLHPPIIPGGKLELHPPIIPGGKLELHPPTIPGGKLELHPSIPGGKLKLQLLEVNQFYFHTLYVNKNMKVE